MDLKLKGKTALISGSSKGIGFNIANALYDEGCDIVINGRNTKNLQSASKKIGSNIGYFTADMTNYSECQKLVKYTIKLLGKIDILVCNVGDGTSSKPGTEKIIDWQKMIDINLNSSINLISASLNSLKKTSGNIVCVSSIAGVETTDAPVGYSIAKSALNHYVKNMSKPFAKHGIRINAVAPGNIFFKGSVWEKKLQKNRKRVKNMLSTKVPMNRFGTPEEISNVVTFLSSPVSSFMTGNIIIADGGQTRS